ncbi:MAG: putative O-glycosylation ligase, exosortase A system-associated [Pseudomonadota bacterium]
MKDLFLLAFVFGCLVVSLRYPFAGVITWTWFTIMTPHQMAYGTFGIPLNLLIAGVTLFAVVYSREAQRFRADPITLLLLVFLLWQTVAQHLSLLPAVSGEYYSRLSKTLIFTLLCAQMVTDKLRFHAITWVLAGGIGFFAVKGALFTLVTLGQYRVQGLENTVLEDNNHFGIAVATMIPLLAFMRQQSRYALIRHGLALTIGLSIVAVIGTHSRGALVALVVFGLVLWWRSRHKVSLAALALVLMVPAISFMPSKWIDRMQTIGSASEDASFRGRLDAWEINWRLALDHPVTGVGLRNAYDKEIAAISAPDKAEAAKAAHSIYFEVLGGSGFVGLALFLSLFGAAVLTARSIEFSKSAIPDWHRQFAHYAQISLLIFAVGGASTSMEMWDGYLLIIALIAALTRQAHAASAAGTTIAINRLGKVRPPRRREAIPQTARPLTARQNAQ